MSSASVTILGVRLDRASWDSILGAVRKALDDKRACHIVTLNGEIALIAKHDQEYLSLLNSSDLVIADSTNICWAARLLGFKTDRTPGSVLTLKLCTFAQKNKRSVYLLGGRGDVPEKTALELTRQFPKLKIAGYSNRDPDDRDELERLRALKPEIVFVAYGAPKQERWIAAHKSALPPAVYVGIGGTFDVISGKKRRPPEILRRISLEWLWRLMVEPTKTRCRRTINALVVFPLIFLANDLLHKRSK